MKYRIMFDFGSYEGYKMQDGEYDTVNEAVKQALDLSYSAPFIIVNIVDWSAIHNGCPYTDCPKVKYKECPIHGTN